ncbi:MAG TPA: Nramp family divalent metal transporter [Vicinamibacterales bacterium]|nr:Nramp family divalent metal transporter [Vicinamibacterales bacterium]
MSALPRRRADEHRAAVDSAPTGRPAASHGVARAVGLGLITGAADDDPSAIGTYAAAGAAVGPAILWTAPVTFPMMFAVVYLSAKLGQVTGQGLFAVIRAHYARRVLWITLVGVVIGNTFEAAADLGGMAAALQLLIPWRFEVLVTAIGAIIFALQWWGSYETIRNVFRVLALVLLAYVGAAFLAHPDWPAVLRGTLVPTLRFDRETLSLLVAIIGTSLSAYLYTWQSNQEVEEEIAMGRRRLRDRVGASRRELAESRRDILYGMVFSNIVMYFIILSTAATLFAAHKGGIQTAADAAKALEPLAGRAAGILFTLGVVGVGFLAIPVMTTGAAYDVSQSFGWHNSLGAKPHEAGKFYGVIAGVTAIAVGLNFLGLNPMKVLVWSGIVQGFSTPPLMLLILRMTNNRRIMGQRTNGLAINTLGWITTAAIFAASAGLAITWFI